jgi:hypothetical protein
LLDWLESFSFALWLRESPSVWSSATVLTLHTMGMSALVGASWVLDLRLLGMIRTVPLSAFRWVFKVVTVSLVVNIVTGLMLFIKNATMWGTAPPFFIKMAFVIASAATLVPIRRYVLSSGAGQLEVPGRARLLAIVSICAWTAAVTAGRLLAYLVV